MYIPSSFRQDDLASLHALMTEYNFATLVSQHEGKPVASHLPFLLQAEPGQFGTLWTHLAKANPQWRSLTEGEVLVIFQGPHAYISPSWYEVVPSVPTWNYAVVHAYGQARRMDEAATLHEFMGGLVHRHEDGFSQPWRFEELADDYVQKMMAAIVGFEIEITRLEGKFKLSQNRSAQDQHNVVEALQGGDELARETARMMRP